MTCIVGLIDGKNVLIGGDSAGVDTTTLALTLRADEKVFKKTDGLGNVWVFGYTTSFRMGQLLRYHLVLPAPTKEEQSNLFQFMVEKLIPAVRECLEKGGWRTKKEERESGGEFIVGLLGELFAIDSDFQVKKPVFPFLAVGSGASVALGALYASGGLSAEKRVITALEAAEAFNVGVRRPFKIVATNK